MLSRLSVEKRYRVADVMAPSFRNLAKVDRRVAFGVVINSPIKLNGKQTTLNQAFDEEIATHITNLVLRRVQGSVVPEISL
jgi:hypothetical protein